MIEFPCICGYAFELPDELEGGLIQCPECHRLNDVPTRAELKQFATDGTYLIDAPAPRPNPDAVAADLAYIYQKGPRDAEGNEIDLRPTAEERARAGIGEPIPLATEPERSSLGPRYDPETGELIEPMPLKGEEADNGDSGAPINPATIPLAKAVFNYASGETVRRPGFLRIFLHLLAPLNLAVMFAIFVMHVLLWPMITVIMLGIFFMLVGMPAIAGAIIAHYGNVIEDTGPFERDELPRPLRDVGWYEDLWYPFCNVFLSGMLCYGPMFVLPLIVVRFPAFRTLAIPVGIAFGGIGTFVFPAVVLTLQTSGTILNLRPDRVLSVIAACGRDYFVTLILWVIAAVLYAWGCAGSSLAMIDMLRPLNAPRWLVRLGVDAGVLALGIFFMHFFCMAVGLLYRAHYDRFPWVLQRHISTRDPNAKPGLPPSRRRPKWDHYSQNSRSKKPAT